MKTQGQRVSAPRTAGWKQIWPYALLSFVALVFGCLLLSFLIWHGDRIVALGLTGRLYYIALLPLALSVSTILFGILRSVGKYSGQVFGGRLELGGSAVGFFLVIILGFQLPQPAQNFSLTVITHGEKGNTDMVLRSSGSLVLDTGGQRRTAPIGPNGDAVFLEIPANMRGQKASLGLDSEDFDVADPKVELTLSPTTVYVEIHRKVGRLAGHVYGSGDQPLPGVTISVGNLRATSDDQGFFEMQITGEDANRDVTLVATKPGYRTWTGLETLNSNDVTIPLEKAR
jgi:hypothetical protein